MIPSQLPSNPSIYQLRCVRPKLYPHSTRKTVASRHYRNTRVLARQDNTITLPSSRDGNNEDSWIQFTIRVDVGGDLKETITSVKRMVNPRPSHLLLFPFCSRKESNLLIIAIYFLGTGTTDNLLQPITTHGVPAEMAPSAKHLPQTCCGPPAIPHR
jgi:hypothetical protein